MLNDVDYLNLMIIKIILKCYWCIFSKVSIFLSSRWNIKHVILNRLELEKCYTLLKTINNRIYFAVWKSFHVIPNYLPGWWIATKPANSSHRWISIFEPQHLLPYSQGLAGLLLMYLTFVSGKNKLDFCIWLLVCNVLFSEIYLTRKHHHFHYYSFITYTS